jgi:heme-degrading monooxygenase HmoA
MIVRMWGARATRENLPRYTEFFRRHVLPELERLPGFVDASVLAGDGADSPIEIVVLTRWESMDAVRGFAREDVGAAVVQPEAAALLLDFDQRVRHFTIALTAAS